MPQGALSDGLYWDTLDDYHYVRLQPKDGKNDYLIVCGADHKSGEADDAEVRFEAWKRGCGILCLNWASRRIAGQARS